MLSSSPSIYDPREIHAILVIHLHICTDVIHSNPVINHFSHPVQMCTSSVISLTSNCSGFFQSQFLIKSWSSAEDESVRVLSFFSIIRITKLEKKKYLEYVLKVVTYVIYQTLQEFQLFSLFMNRLSYLFSANLSGLCCKL